MSTPTPQTDAAQFDATQVSEEGGAYLVVGVDFARTLETELTAANARIAELEKREAFLKSKGMTVGMLSASNHEPTLAYHIESGSELCNLRYLTENQSLTRQLSEAQAQFRIAQNRVHWPEPPEDCIFCETYPATGSPQEVPMCKLCCLESERELLTAQLASAREDEKLYRELEISITDVQDWSGTRVGDALDAIDSARDVTSPPTPAETATESTWQPIETAPKDGTRVLTLHKRRGVRFGRWESDKYATRGPKPFWDTIGPYNSIREDRDDPPTHWQPLPPPPQGKEQGE